MDNQNLQKWALIAEIVGGIAVLVTLLFLIVEVRENSAVIRASAYGQTTDMLNDWRLLGASDPELTALFREYFNGRMSTLNEVEVQQMYFFLATLWGTYENAYFARQYDILGSEEWSRILVQACEQYRVAEPQNIWNGLSNLLSTEFHRYIPTECGD